MFINLLVDSFKIFKIHVLFIFQNLSLVIKMGKLCQLKFIYILVVLSLIKKLNNIIINFHLFVFLCEKYVLYVEGYLLSN